MSSTGLPPDWTVRHSKSKNVPYYFHGPTQTSQWSPPATDEALSAPVAPQTQKVRAAHLLVKHRGSRRPSSWKSPEITRTHEEATEIVRGFESSIRNAETTLAQLAKHESDCSSARKGGDLFVSHYLRTNIEICWGTVANAMGTAGSLGGERCRRSLKMWHSRSSPARCRDPWILGAVCI